MCRLYFIFLLLLAAIFSMGCSNVSNVTLPSDSFMQNQNLPVGITDQNPDGSPSAGSGVLGLFSMHLDTEKEYAEIVSLRSNTLTDVLEIVDITNFLQVAPCTDCAQIKSVELNSDNNLVVSIGVKHPFGVGDPLKPISGQNRADLHVFNVEGMVVSNSTATTFPGLGKNVADFNLVNADGYFDYLDTVLDDIYPTDASVHPYITHFDDYSSGNFDPANVMGFASVTDPPPSGNLVMAMGCDFDYQDYEFDIEGAVDFIFAIGCTYGVSSASKGERFSPEYRVPQHNKKAASEVSIEIVSNDLVAGDTSSTAQLEIHVVDISHAVPVGVNLDEMLADSSVGEISLEVPGIESGLVSVDISSPSGSGHDPADPLIYSTIITNAAAGSAGTFTGLLKVLDSYSPGLNSSPLLNNMDGITRVDPVENPLTGLFNIPEFATYAAFGIEISSVSNEPPVAVLNPESIVIFENDSVLFDGTDSYDNDGSIVLYEFDFDWDGIETNFAADDSNSTGTVTSLPYTTQGTFTAGLRVTDDRSDVAYDSSDVTVCGETLTNWRTDLPQCASSHRYSGRVIIDDKIWILGGAYQFTVDVFDMTTETWDTSPHANIPDGRGYFAAAHYDGKIYCMGGLLGGRINTTIVYDIDTNSWDTTSVPAFIGPPRNVCTATSYNDEIFLCYGLNWDYGGTLNDLDIYTPATNSWRLGTSAPVRRASPFFEVVGDRIYGGCSNNSSAPNSQTIEYYDPATDSWTTVGNINRMRGGAGSVVVGTKIILVGGHQNTTNAWNWVDQFDTVTEQWTQLLDLPEDRGFLSACGFYECKLYVTTGQGDSYQSMRTTIAGEFF